MIFPKDRGQPVSLTDEYGFHWVDNGDGTVTWMNDPDGERDIPWDSADGTDVDVAGMHTLDCRRSADAGINLHDSPCPGGQDCADTERAVYASSQACSIFARQHWGVFLSREGWTWPVKA